MTTTWARSVRYGCVRTDPRRNKTRHRGEVYGEQFDDGRIKWWRECADCGLLVKYPTWYSAVLAAIRHHQGIS